MKKYKVIAFDLDGTLTDPAHGLICSFQYALEKMGIDYGEKSELKRFIGPPLYDEWQSCYGLSPEEATRALLLFREYYAIYGWWDNEIYKGIPELLARLKAAGKKIILATSKPEEFAKKILDLFDIAKYFDFIGGASTDKIRDKKWEVLEYSMKNLGEPDKSEYILVGDRKYDAEGAQICGIDSLGVLYGHGTREELEAAGFNYIADTPEAVAELLI